ncbi:MAG TPA: LPXTG cell wall anchor domain-containing protein [Acidimicrobiales bacterium]
MKRVCGVLFGLVALLTVTLGFTAPAEAQTVVVTCTSSGNYGNVTITISVTTVPPGVTVTITGSGFLPNCTIVITLGPSGTVLGETVSDANGNFSFDFPAPQQPGTYSVTASDGVNAQTVEFTVVAAATPVEGAGTLPYTGNSSSIPVAQIGAVMVAAGAVLVLGVRKRQHRVAAVRVED